MNNALPRTDEDLRYTDKGLRYWTKVLSIRVDFNGREWIAVKDDKIIARENSRRMAMACAIAHAESAAMDEDEPAIDEPVIAAGRVES